MQNKDLFVVILVAIWNTQQLRVTTPLDRGCISTAQQLLLGSHIREHPDVTEGERNYQVKNSG